MINHCCSCGTNLDGTAWLCHKCAKDNEVETVPYFEWPKWLKAMKNNEKAERRRRIADAGRLAELPEWV